MKKLLIIAAIFAAISCTKQEIETVPPTVSEMENVTEETKARYAYIENDVYLGEGIIQITSDTIIWSPVNCGYTPDNPNGMLYQWGRKYGSPATEAVTPCTMEKTDDTEDNHNLFGIRTSRSYCWHTGDIDNDLWKEDGTGTNEPCPDGWRIPTARELEILMSAYSAKDTINGVPGYSYSVDFDKEKQESIKVFLPAVGYRNMSGKLIWDDGGHYWSSSTDKNYACRVILPDTQGSHFRCTAMAVRCVKININ